MSFVASNIKSSFVPYVLFPMSHYLGSIAISSSPRTSSYHIFPLPNLTHLRRGGISLPQTPSSNITNLPCRALSFPLPQSINQSPPFLVYTDGSCPDQLHISPQKPRRLGCLLRKYLSGSLWSGWLPSVSSQWLQQHCRVTGTFGSHCIYAPLPPHIVFHLDSQYVLESLTNSLVFPSPPQFLNLQFFYWITVAICPRRLVSNSEKPNLTQANPVTTKQTSMPTKDSPLTPLSEFAIFPPLELPSLHYLNSPSAAPDSLNIIQTITSSDECFPPKPPIARKPTFLQTLSH